MGEEWLHHDLLHKLTAVNRQLWQVVAGMVVVVGEWRGQMIGAFGNGG